MGGGIVSSKCLYHYTIAITENHMAVEKKRTSLTACEKILELDCIKSLPEIKKKQEALYVKHCIQLAKRKDESLNNLYEYRKLSQKYVSSFIKSKHISLKQKMAFLILQIFPKLIRRI